MNNTNKNIKVLIAPDKFKGSLTSLEISNILLEVVQRQYPNSKSVILPMADGGDGSLEAVEFVQRGVHKKYYNVYGLNKLDISVPIIYWDKFKNDGSFFRTAMIEMAKVCGISSLEKRDVMNYTTRGLGELIRDVINDLKVNKLLISLGGSATSDGGVGMLRSLGFKVSSSFHNVRQSDFNFSRDTVAKICPSLFETEIVALVDVQNPLLGINGASRVFASQKGATEAEVEVLEKTMKYWSNKVMEWRNKNNHSQFFKQDFYGPGVPGAGAAGGVGFALNTVFSAEILSGWNYIADRLNLEKYISEADLIISGEGKLDAQTFNGKCVDGIGSLCKKYHKTFYVICGQNELDSKDYFKRGITKVFSLMEMGYSANYCITHAEELLKKIIFVGKC
ncbi:MAG: glycerate kinase [Bacteroidales bacterium]